jgi:hypothetical protein
MELILLITILVCVVITIALQVKNNNIKQKDVVDGILKAMTADKPVDVISLFHPKVWDAYREYMNNPESWQSGYCTITNNKDVVWAANDLDSRRFYSHTPHEEYVIINNKLTHYDKMLLDHLVTAVKRREKMIALKLFIS